MFRLLVKDFMLLKKNLWIGIFYSFLIFFFFPQNEASNLVYTMGISMISYLLVMYITAYEDKNKSEVLINSLPLIRKQIVASRYISVFIFISTGFVFMFISSFILRKFHVINIARGLQLMDLAGAAIGILFLCSFYFPLFFKIGYVKAKLFNLGIFGMFFIIPLLLKNLLNNTKKPQWVDHLTANLSTMSDWSISLILIGGISIIYFLSYIISSQFYQAREF